MLPSAFGEEDDRPPVLAAGTFPQAVADATGHRRVLLVFDQFEELITLFDGDADALAAQARVLDAILQLLRSTEVRAKLLFVFREDYLAALEPLVLAQPQLSDQFLRLISPPVECASQIIRAPFVRYGSAFGRELSDDVAERVAAALKARSRTGALNLSELQIVCRRLWDAEDPGGLLESQGVEGLLEAFLNERLADFGGALGDVAVAVLTRLVTLSGTRNVVSHDDLVTQAIAETGCDGNAVEDVMDRLASGARLIRSERAATS